MIEWTPPDGNTGASRPEVPTRSWWGEWVWLDGGPVAGVRVTADAAGVTVRVERGVPPIPADVALPGLVLPGLANTHSHAFHRALRGRTHTAGGSFWTWREAMYALAGRLDPDSYLLLATAVYAEMALAGVSCVGEFHYLHHQPDGTPYADANAMGKALREAAHLAGIRLTLLDACYLSGGIGAPLRPEQQRFSDGDAERWAERVEGLAPDATTRVGAAIHSVRAVPPEQVPTVVAASRGRPLHVHLAEQRAEVDACLRAYGVTPGRLLAERGALGPGTTAVHATHLDGRDVELLGQARATACMCPTTERDLADGIGPARALHAAGVPLALGSDQHALVDMFEEARAMEMHERLATGARGHFTATELVEALTASGHAALGWPEAGRIAPGGPCDLVAVRLDTVRTAGVDPAQAVLAATAADVDTVVVSGRTVVTGGAHGLGDVGRLLADAVGQINEGAP